MTGSIRLAGVSGAPGIAIGPAWRFRAAVVTASPAAPAARGDTVPTPADAIRAASAETARQLEVLAGRIRDLGRDEEAAIFDAQALMGDGSDDHRRRGRPGR